MQNVVLNLSKKEKKKLLKILEYRTGVQVPIHYSRDCFISTKKRLWDREIGLMTITKVETDDGVSLNITVEFKEQRFIEPTKLYSLVFNDEYSLDYAYPTY